MNKMDMIKKMVKAITESGLPLMEGKEKLEVEGSLLGNTLTVEEYGYMEGTNKDTGAKEEYVVISLREYPNNFIYGSSVVTEGFKKFDEMFKGDEESKNEILKEGLTFQLSKVTSANKRKYTKIEFFPGE